MITHTSQTRKQIPDLLFLLTWLVIPNIVFTGFYTIGIGSRQGYILAYATVAIALSLFYNKPLVAVLCLFVLLDLFETVSSIFGFAPTDLGRASRYVPMLSFGDSVAFYSPFFFILLSPISLIWFSRTYRPQRPVIASALLLLISFVVGSFEFSMSGAKNYGKTLKNSDAKNFESALINMSYDHKTSQHRPKKIILIMVESLGVYRDPVYWQDMKDQLFAAGDRSDFIVQEGTSRFFGHTTTGELRELCSLYTEYTEIGNLPSSFFAGCLPNILAKEGYQTHAIHGFEKEFFERAAWYPLIGFQNSIFRNDMSLKDMTICSGVFTGPCDTSVLEKIVKPLTQTPSDDFIYYLTLTSHLPFVAKEYDTPYSCDVEISKFTDFQVCQLTNYFHHFFGDLGVLIADLKDDDVEIMIIGDHTPPFVRFEARNHFNEELVPWLHIKTRKSDTENQLMMSRIKYK